MTRAYCLNCNEQVDVDADGRCPRGHVVSTEDLGPQPWIGRALSAVGNPPARMQAAESGSDETASGEPDELAALLADLDDGGPADLVTDEGATTADTADELAALAEELAWRAESPGSVDEDEADDTLGALDDAISAWDESDDSIVAPSEPVPADDRAADLLAADDDDEPVIVVTADELAAADRIPPPPPADAEPPTTAPPPPPPPAPASPLEDIFADGMPSADEDMPPPIEEPMEEPEEAEEEPPAAAVEAAPREIDLTNFTASGKRIDTSSAPRKKGGRFGFGR